MGTTPVSNCAAGNATHAEGYTPIITQDQRNCPWQTCWF